MILPTRHIEGYLSLLLWLLLNTLDVGSIDANYAEERPSKMQHVYERPFKPESPRLNGGGTT